LQPGALASAASRACFTDSLNAGLDGLATIDLVLAATSRSARDPTAIIWAALRDGDPSLRAALDVSSEDMAALAASRSAVDFAVTAPLSLTFFDAIPAGSSRAGRSVVLLQVPRPRPQPLIDSGSSTPAHARAARRRPAGSLTGRGLCCRRTPPPLRCNTHGSWTLCPGGCAPLRPPVPRTPAARPCGRPATPSLPYGVCWTSESLPQQTPAM
jgi:hypothetical protein